MIHARCIPTELLLERKAPSLSHAERLRVETHLAECARCRREHGAMLGLLALVEQKLESSVKSNVQERAIARAMLRSREQSSVIDQVAPAGFRLARPWAWGLAAATLATLLVVGSFLRGGSAARLGTAQVGQLSGDRVVVGSLSIAGKQLAVDDPIPAHRELHPEGALTVSLAHAKVSVRDVASMTWSPEDRVVSLRGGVADVSVDPSRHQSFRVVTPHFLVNVIGTEFRIASEHVTVTRGRVRVSSPSGQLWAELGPGQSWSYVAPADGGELAQAAPAVQPTEPVEVPAGNRSSADTKSPSAVSSATELLARARHRLAAGDTRAALIDLDAALAAGGSRGQQAEASTLKADCALVQGDARAAVRQYLDVSRRFSGLRAAETALFAAARTEANGGNKASAKKLLLMYREQYPAGQFRNDVDARLRILEAQ